MRPLRVARDENASTVAIIPIDPMSANPNALGERVPAVNSWLKKTAAHDAPMINSNNNLARDVSNLPTLPYSSPFRFIRNGFSFHPDAFIDDTGFHYPLYVLQ